MYYFSLIWLERFVAQYGGVLMIFSMFIALAIIVLCVFGFYVSVLNKKDIATMLFSVDELIKSSVEPALQSTTENSKVAILKKGKFKIKIKRLEYDVLKNTALFKKIYGTLNRLRNIITHVKQKKDK